MKTIKPNGSYIFAKPIERETKTASGFLLTEGAAEQPKSAEVINIGPNVTTVTPKSIIVYKIYTTTDIKLNGQEYILLAEEDVLGEVIDVEKANA